MSIWVNTTDWWLIGKQTRYWAKNTYCLPVVGCQINLTWNSTQRVNSIAWRRWQLLAYQLSKITIWGRQWKLLMTSREISVRHHRSGNEYFFDPRITSQSVCCTKEGEVVARKPRCLDHNYVARACFDHALKPRGRSTRLRVQKTAQRTRKFEQTKTATHLQTGHRVISFTSQSCN